MVQRMNHPTATKRGLTGLWCFFIIVTGLLVALAGCSAPQAVSALKSPNKSSKTRSELLWPSPSSDGFYVWPQ